MDYPTYCYLLSRGARWGDIECLEEEDILLDLEKRRVEIEMAKENRRLYLEKVKARPKPVPKPPAPAPPRAPPRPRAPRPCLRKCIGCKKFTIHSNPPPHFTDKDKNYCCAYCNITDGKKHGGSCERNR